MATTRAFLVPLAMEPVGTDFPNLYRDGEDRWVLAFDPDTEETCAWTMGGWQGLTGTLTAIITYRMDTATTGGVAFDVAVEAITDGDAIDTGAASGFDTVNPGSESTVKATAGHIDQISITLTNQDGIAAADYVRISLARDVDDSADNASGDAEVLLVEIRDAA